MLTCTRGVRRRGYIDYVCPQLYYSFENEALPFETALQIGAH